MKRLLIFTFIALFSLPLMAQKRYDEIVYPELNAFQMPEVEEFSLDNGITFYLVEDKELPLIRLNAIVKTSSILEPAHKTGLASLTGQIMRSGGSLNYPADELNLLLENKAASISTYIGESSGGASMNLLKEDFAELLPVFVDLVQNPLFPEDKIDLAKTQSKSGISRRNDDQQSVAIREFEKIIYGKDSPYTQQVEYATIDAITKEDMIDFHKNAFVGNNMMIGVIGDFDSNDMKRKLREAFGSLPAGTATNLIYPEVNYDFSTSISLVDKPDVNQSFVLLGHIGGLRDNPDYAALQVMNRVLSGGFSSRLFQEVRTNLGLAYAVFGSYGSNINYPGMFYTGVMTKSSTTAEAIDAIVNEIKKLQNEPIKPEELQDTKDQFLNSLVFRYDSKSKILSERINNEYNGLSQDAFDELVEGIKATTTKDVQRVAKEYLNPDKMQILVVGNAGEIGNQLDKYGNVEELDITIPTPVVDEEPIAAGDAVKGLEWLQKMADAIIAPGTEFETIDEKAVTTQQTPMGAMELEGSSTINYQNLSAERTLQTPQGEMQMSIKNGGGTLTMMGQQQPLPPQMAQPIIKEMQRNYLAIALRASNLEAEYMGDETSDGVNFAVIRLTGDTKITFLLDPATGLPARSRFTEMNPQTGQPINAELIYSDWKTKDGVTYAYSVTTLMDGEEAGNIKVESHSVN